MVNFMLDIELQIVRYFQSWSCKFLDVFFEIINAFGTDLLFYLVFLGLYWMYSKAYAFKYMAVYLGTVGCNKVFKSLVKRPRPAGATESGYSFPSGHAMSYMGVSTQLVYEMKRQGYPKKKWQQVDMWLEYIIFGLLVAIARMYFGVHYLTDVLTGLIFGAFVVVAITFILNWLIEKFKGKIKYELILLCLMPVVLIVYIVVACTNIITDVGALTKVYRFSGFFLAVAVGYFVDKKFIKYDGKLETAKNKIIKTTIGLGVIISTYILLIAKVTDFKLGIYIFLLGIFATVVLPWIFKTINNEPLPDAGSVGEREKEDESKKNDEKN